MLTKEQAETLYRTVLGEDEFLDHLAFALGHFEDPGIVLAREDLSDRTTQLAFGLWPPPADFDYEAWDGDPTTVWPAFPAGWEDEVWGHIVDWADSPTGLMPVTED